ncbi:LapA family protein [Marispirochaeta sp.]|jgi:uncharacterized integral membrane protein|uniref:LapA family protein n=1 Tax=Marispirochaeta sp. TaxID=2038653 RepID=UPI0029C68557|nr:LapA family protein [Marispirochaeta sp.]
MPWRLIFVVLLIGIVLFFVGFNIENRADVSFGFHVFSQVPIFISLFVAFLAGILVMLPFTFGFRHKRKIKDKLKREKTEKKERLPKPEGKKNKDLGSIIYEESGPGSDSETKNG